MTRPRTLEAYQARQVEEAYRDAVTSGGQVPEDRLAALDRLQKLVDMAHAVQKQRPWRRWIVAMPFLVTLAVVSALLFVHKAHTDIELEVLASEVDFELGREQVIAPVTQLGELAASGLQSVTLPDAEGGQDTAAPEREDRIRLTAEDHAGTITLDPLSLPARTRVQLRAERGHRCFLAIKPARLSAWDLKATVKGRVDAVLATGRKPLTLNVPSPVLLIPEEGSVELRLEAPAAMPLEFSDQLNLAALSLDRVEQYWRADDMPPVPRRLSTIISGTLIFESLNSLEYKLRYGELLRLTLDANGVVRYLRLEDNHISLRFHGSVRDLQAGSEENPIDLRPTLLDWLRARHGLSLLWGTVLYLSGIVLAVLRWLGVLQ